MNPADNNAPVSEEVRKLAKPFLELIFAEKAPIDTPKQVYQLLSDALRKEGERLANTIRNETSNAWRVGAYKAKKYLGADELREAASSIALCLHHADQVDAAIERGLAAKGARHER